MMAPAEYRYSQALELLGSLAPWLLSRNTTPHSEEPSWFKINIPLGFAYTIDLF